MPLWMGFHFRDAIQHRALKIELHHYADSLGKAAFMPTGKFKAETAPMFNQPAKRWQRLAESVLAFFSGS